MGNSCVIGKIAVGAWLYTLSNSLWGSTSPDEKSTAEIFAIKPPKLVKIDELRGSQPPAVAKEGFEPLQTAAGARDEVIRRGGKRSDLVLHTEHGTFKVYDEMPKKAEGVKKMMSVGLQVKSVLKTRTGHLKEHFKLGHKLGHGQYGTTFLCVEKATGKSYACKSIAKRKLLSMEDVHDVRREIEIMHHLSGNPNVISIRGAYEDAVAVHAVMELCTGGELFDRIVKRGPYTEKKAAELAIAIFGVVETCHSLGVMHRDLKPENFLFVNEDEDSPMKAIDFGLSAFFKPGDVFTEIVGSPYYVAPEILCQRYGPEADVWSAGVIVYILLCGVPPFWGESEDKIFDEVLYGEIDFTSDPWPEISECAKDFVRNVLVRDPRNRLTAHQALSDSWLQLESLPEEEIVGPREIDSDNSHWKSSRPTSKNNQQTRNLI